MSSYKVKDVVCDYGVYENEKLIHIFNDKENAELVRSILESDSKHKRHDSEKTIISEYEYESLQEDSEKLNALEIAGVDNWEGYDYAMDILHGIER